MEVVLLSAYFSVLNSFLSCGVMGYTMHVFTCRNATIPNSSCLCPGILALKNTLDDFKTAPKKELLEAIGKEVGICI